MYTHKEKSGLSSLILFSFFIFASFAKAATVTVDLNVTYSIQQSVVEATQPYSNLITISNLNASGTVDANGANIIYSIPSGASYNNFIGSGWSCSHDTTSVTCNYSNSLPNGQTSNQLDIEINAPNSIATVNSSVSTSLSGTIDPDTSNNSASDSIQTGKSNLNASKTVSNTPLQLGENFTYSINVSNPAAADTTVSARDVTLSDTLPGGIVFASFNSIPNGWNCSEASNVISCSGLNLAVGDNKTLTINVQAPLTSTGQTITNHAYINTSSSDHNTLPLDKTVDVVVQPADVKLTQSLLYGLDSSSATIDSNVTYQLHVTNIGASPAYDVNITETLPAGATLINTTGAWSCNGTSTLICTLNDTNLTGGETYDLNVNVTMPSTHGTVTNSATAYTSTGDGDTTNNTTSLDTTVKGADLNIVKTPDGGNADVGTNYTYTIKVDNAGLADAHNVVVTDTLDSSMSYQSDTAGCVQSGQTLTCNLGNIQTGANSSFTVTVKMPTNSLNDVINNASVTTSTDQENSSNLSDSATTHIKGPNLNITKDANVTEIGLGKTFSYTLNVVNTNSANATNAKITDTLPSGIKLIGILSNSAGWSCPSFTISAGTTFDCNLSTIAGNTGNSITFEAQALTTQTGNQRNNVTISHSLNTNDGTAYADVNISEVTLTISKSASATAITGGLIDYNVTVTNNSYSDAQNVTITDDLASSLGSGYTINSIINSTGWSCSVTGTSTLSCTKNSDLLAKGDTSTIHFNVKVPFNAALGTATNSAQVHTTTLPAPTETATADTTIMGADIVVVPPTTITAIANANVTWSVQIRNDGTAVAKDVNITNYFNTASITNGDFTNIKIDCAGGTNYVTVSNNECQLGDISSGATKTITISATAPNYDSDFPGHNKINNRSIAVTSTSQSNISNDTKNWMTSIHGADLVIYKTSDKSEVAVDGVVTYTIKVKNQWEANATNIQVTDDILGTSPDAFSFTGNPAHDGNWTCTVQTSSKFICNYTPILQYNQTTSAITIQAKAPNVLSAIDNHRDNQAKVTNSTAEKETATTNTVVLPITIRGADLNISKTVNPTSSSLNQVVTYTINVVNNGLADANATYVNDTLPNGFTNISTSGCSNDSSSVTGNSIHCTLGDLAQNANKSFTITTNAPNTNGTYTNTATTSSNTLEKNTADNNASVDLQVQGADLIPYKSAPAKVAGNSTFTYTISLRNIGTSTAYGAEINDTIPTNNGTTYVSGSLNTLDSNWTCSLSGSNLHCYTNDSNLSIPNGYNSNIVSFKVKAGPATYTINNTVTTDTNTSESSTTNNSYTANTEVIDIDLEARKLINNNNYGANENYIDINGTLVYKIQVQNASPIDINITDVNVTDLIPSNIPSIISITSNSRFTCNNISNPGDTLVCTMKNGLISPLQRSEGWIDVATITIKALNQSQFDVNNENNNFIINKYKAETSLSDEDLGNNAPTGGDGYLHTNTLVRGSNMSITKTVSSNLVGANKQFGYTLSIKNWPRTGNLDHDIPSTNATNIVVKDKLPSDVNFTSATGTNWSCTENSKVVSCNYSGIMPPANSTSNIDISVTAPNTDQEILTNEANVTNDTPELVRLLPDNTDSVTTTTQGTDISITKTGPATAGMSDHITYNITVTNSSAEADAKNVYIIDTLPNGATYDGNISNSHWTSSVEANGSIKFTYDQVLLMSTQTNFTFSSTLPHYTGTARNHVEAFTSTIETSTPNLADWDTDIKGADLVFKNIPTQNPNPVGAYGHHEYYIVIHNQGLSPASDINVTVNLNNAGSNPGWMDVNGSGTGWSCDAYDSNNSKLVCHLPSLAKSSDSSTLTINSTAPNYNGDIINSATVIGKDDTNASTGETKNVTTTIKGSDLKITKYANDPDPQNPNNAVYYDNNITIGVGKSVNFKFTVTNNNLGLAKDIYIKDIFPAGFSDINITNQGDWNCSVLGLTLTCSRTQLAPNTNAQDILVSAKAPVSIQTITNSADINTTTQETDTTNNHDDVIIALEGATLDTNLNINKTQVAFDEIFTYDLNITNTGKNDGIDLNITDILPSDLTYMDNNGSDSGWSCSESNNTVLCQQPLISAYGGNSKLLLNVKAPSNKKGIYSNHTLIESNSIKNPITTYAPDIRVVGADLIVDINATPTDVLEDRNVTYVINVKDINISTAKDVNFTQIFSPHATALYIVNSGGGTCSLTDANQSVSCQLGDIAYNTDKNITIIATMPKTNTLIDPLRSTVDVATSSQQENTNNDSAFVDVKVYPIKPDIQYHFEECTWNGTSGEVKDALGSLNATAENGTKTLNHLLSFDDNNFSTVWRTGSFDGTNDYISIPNNSLINTTSHNKRSISLWFDSNVTNSNNQVIYQEGGGTNGLAIYIRNSNLYVGGWNHGTNWDSGTYLNTPITINKWHHVVLTLNTNEGDPNTQPNTFKAYLDGSAFTSSGDGSELSSHTGAVSIGDVEGGTRLDDTTTSSGHEFSGAIDEVEIYNIALDARAVNDIYNFEKAGKNYDGSDRAETICGVDLQVVKTASPSGNVGAESNLTYNITITNLSDEPVTKGFTFSDTLPTDTTYNSDSFSSNLSCIGTSDISCTFPNTVLMKKGDTENISINVTMANKDKTDVTNTATATPIQPENNPNDNNSSKTNTIIGTDLKITKIATPTKPNPGDNFIYTVKIENISSYANAHDIVMQDKFDSRLTYGSSIVVTSNETNVTSSCTVPSNNLITCDVNKLSMGNYIQFDITMKSDNIATALINEANVTSVTKDTDLSNNSVTLSTDTNTSASGVDIIELHEKYFKNDLSINKYGNIATIGNTMLVAPSIASGTKLNDVNSTYANSLGGSHTDSSSATLTVLDTNNSNPDDNITIEYAGLYWGGHIHGNDKNDTGANVPFNQVTFITPDGVAHYISADKNDTNISSTASNRIGYYYFKKGDENNNTANMGNYRIFYGAKADITSIVKGLTYSQLQGGVFTVADMNITQGHDFPDWAPSGASWERFRDYGYFGGWSMVVAYSINHRYHREIKFKNLSSFSGFRVLTPQSPGSIISLPVDINGFITPLHGAIESTLFNFSQGGDRELSLENMTVNDKNSISHFVIEDTNNTTNIFNDSISLRDVNDNLITKTPNESYNVGTDIDQYNLNSEYDSNGSCINSDGRPCYLSNFQNSTKVTLSVQESSILDGVEYPSEQAFAQMMTMSTQIFAPDFIDSYKECFKLKEPLSPQLGWVSCSEPLPPLRRGDIVKYRVTVLNTGDDYANDVYVTDVLPKEVNYEHNSTIVTNLYPFESLETNSPCSDPNYNSSQTIRDECISHLKYIVDGNETNATYILPNGENNTTDMLNHSFNGVAYGDINNTLVFTVGNTLNQFPKSNVVWIEFNTTVNSLAVLGNTFKNSVSIKFTNPTLAAFGYGDSTTTQVSLPVESSPVTFNWDNIQIVASDKGRSSVGAKIVNAPFDLNLSLAGISSFDKTDANTSVYINSLRIVDVYNGTNKDIYSSVVDNNVGIPLSASNYTWTTHNTSYPNASKELGFDMNITVKSADGNYTESKMYPYDFNSDPYAGDVFTTRPKEFTISLSGATTSGTLYIVKAGATNLNLTVHAPDINGTLDSAYYNAILSQTPNQATSEISIASDTSYQIDSNATCINPNLSDLNISNLAFTNGSATSPNTKYNEVGVIKLVLKDSNWTAKDAVANDCKTAPGDNNSSDADGLISCSIDGNSTSSIVFTPDHFKFTGTITSNFDGNGTYMVLDPINDPMFADLTTQIEAKNADNNTTTFFSKTCFANDTNINLSYNAQSKSLNDLNISIANDKNLTNITSNSVVTASNNDITKAYANDFTSGTSPLTLRIAVERNATTPLQPALIDPQDLNGSIDNYLGITDANVSYANGEDINSTTDLHFYFGRVHAPDYRYAGNSGTAKIYYEVYCKDCNKTYREDIMGIDGAESVDYIDWYLNTSHTNNNDGQVFKYSTKNDVKFGTNWNTASDETNSTVIGNIANGIESINVVTDPNKLPYIDKVEINATNWVTYDPKTFLLEFQDDGKDWAGQGKLGHIIDSNVSKRSNRRLNW